MYEECVNLLSIIGVYTLVLQKFLPNCFNWKYRNMKRKSITAIFAVFLLLVFILPSFGTGMDCSRGFNEIGSIASESDRINAAYIDDDLAFLLEINRNAFSVYNISDLSNILLKNTDCVRIGKHQTSSSWTRSLLYCIQVHQTFTT